MNNRHRRSSSVVLGSILAFSLTGFIALPTVLAQPQRDGQVQPRRGDGERGGGRFGGGNRGGGRPGMGGGGGGQWWRTQERLGEDEVFKMAEALALDDGQIAIISVMFVSFDEAFQAEVDAAQEQATQMREEVRASGDWTSMMRRSVQMGVESQNSATILEQAFLNDVREMVLTEEQQGRWANYQREYRRRSTLTRGARLPGEGVDLFVVVGDLDLSTAQQAKLTPVLNQYAIEMDDALADRNYYITNVMTKLDDVMTGANNQDPQAVFRKGNEKRQAIRSLNMSYAELLAAQLSPVMGERVLDAFHAKAYPRVYRATDFDNYAETVLVVESLTLAQRDALNTIEMDYKTRMRDVNRQLAVLDTKAQEERQQRMLEGFQMMYSMSSNQDPQAGRQQMMQRFRERMTQQQGQNSVSNPADILRTEKNDLETAALDAFVAVLTAEQLTLAPRPQPEADRTQRQAERAQRREEWRQRMEEGGGRRGRNRGNDM